MEPKKNTWIPSSNGAHVEFAVLAGVDSGKKLYVARARHGGGVIPGKLHIGHPHIFIPFGGQEISKVEYEVLIAPTGSLSWVDCVGGNIPQNAVQGGNDPNGDAYHIGRVIHNGTVTVGKVHKSHETCYVSYDGKEHGYRNYEILVSNAYGKHLSI